MLVTNSFTYAFVTLGLILGLAQGSLAQEAVEQVMTCPVGGEEFTFSTNPFCTPLGSQRRMSFGPDSPCDHVQRIPVCPGNGLPLVRPLNTVEVTQLKQLMATPAYDAIRAKPPFLRASALAEYIDEQDAAIRHGLLIEAWWWETAAFLDDPRHLDDLVTWTEAVLQQTPDDEAPFLQAMLAFALKLSGRDPLADLWLGRANTWAHDDPFLDWYLTLLKGCWHSLDKPECQPEQSIHFIPG